jgi:hypothetical protein
MPNRDPGPNGRPGAPFDRLGPVEKANAGGRGDGGGANVPLPKGNAGLSLERVPLTLLDRWLPARPIPFVGAVAAISGACWLAGLVLAADKHRFLASPDWQLQPLFLAAHFIMLRLFVTAYAKGFLAGCRHLTIDRADAEHRLAATLGPGGWIAAVLLAGWFVYDDLAYLIGPEYVGKGEAQGVGGALGPADWLSGALWSAEWIINAYIWVVILALLAVTMRVLRSFGFRDHVEVVLAERQYKPFLRMSTHGATIVLLFSMVNALYVWHVDGEATDYVGLLITVALLAFGFVPTWLRLKNGIGRLARVEADRLNREVHTGWHAADRGHLPDPKSPEGLASRVSLLLSMARAGHLERLFRDLGRSEGQAMLLRLLAPIGTFVWKIFRPM